MGAWMRILLWAVLLSAMGAGLRGQGATPEDHAVRELVARYAAAREMEDPKSIEALFTSDADQLVSSGEWRHGRENLVKGMLASSRGNPGDRTITVERVRFVAPGVALADARYEIAGTEGREARKMWSTFVAVKSGGEWRLAAIRNMLPAAPVRQP